MSDTDGDSGKWEPVMAQIFEGCADGDELMSFIISLALSSMANGLCPRCLVDSLTTIIPQVFDIEDTEEHGTWSLKSNALKEKLGEQVSQMKRCKMH